MSNQKIDVIEKILNACYERSGYSLFIMSLMHQYEERGFLTKKQMIGLLNQAKKHKEINSGWIATLEATVSKMPNRIKSELPQAGPLYAKDEQTGELITDILAKYPQHKRIVFLEAKYHNNSLNETEKAEIKKLHKLLMK